MKHNARYANQIYDQSLSRIRERLSFLSESRRVQTGTQLHKTANSDIGKGKYTNFTGKIDQLDRECQKVLLDLNQMNAQKRNIELKLRNMREEFLSHIQRKQLQWKQSIKQLGANIRITIAESRQRSSKIEQNYYSSLSECNKIKVNLVEMTNKIIEIEYRLGCNAKGWQSI